jgi:hypothetical protein
MEEAIRSFLERNALVWDQPYARIPMFSESKPKEFSHSEEICGLMALVPGRPCHILVDNVLCFRWVADACYDEETDLNLIDDPEFVPLIREGLQLEADKEIPSEADEDLLDPERLIAIHKESMRDHAESKMEARRIRMQGASDKLTERLTCRRVGIRPGRIKVDGVLGTYHPGIRLVTLYPRMMELVAKSKALREQFPDMHLASIVALIHNVVKVHELCHAWSHAGLDPETREEWETMRMRATSVGIHEIIAEYFSWRFFLDKFMCPEIEAYRMMHLVLCENAPKEYNLWQLLRGVPLERVQRALQHWRKGDKDDFITEEMEKAFSASQGTSAPF